LTYHINNTGTGTLYVFVKNLNPSNRIIFSTIYTGHKTLKNSAWEISKYVYLSFKTQHYDSFKNISDDVYILQIRFESILSGFILPASKRVAGKEKGRAEAVVSVVSPKLPCQL
jgi:hypothetical protein